MSKLNNVNTRDIRDAIALGCRTMSSVFNADDNDIPFFGSQVWPEAQFGFSRHYSEAHVPGRHLNALLTAQEVARIAINEDAVEKHSRAALFSFSGPAALPLNRDAIGGPLVNFDPHNVREGLHALYALTRYRRSPKARELAERAIAAINELWKPDAGWDVAAIEGKLNLRFLGAEQTFLVGLARAIGPLVKFYRSTGHRPALDLAAVLKDKALSDCFNEAGDYDAARFGTHVHSTTCVLSGLAQLADLTRDEALMKRVVAFYDHGLWQLRDAVGWVIESSRPDANPDRGEANNTGDVLETALLLGRWGRLEGYHDAERILRCHLLPAQLRDNSFIADPPNPEGADSKRALADRHLGAFGFPAPYGHKPIGIQRLSFNMDIVGGAVASLCEAYRAITRFDQTGHWVDLLFDYESDVIATESPYTHPALRICIKRPGPLHVRLPPWADPAGVGARGSEKPPETRDGHLFFAEPLVERWISIEFARPESELLLRHRAQNGDLAASGSREIRVRLAGDEVAAMDNFGAELTFFDPIA